MMTMIVPSRLLRRALVLDALASGATGLLTASGARILAGFCNLPESLLTYTGLSLLPFAAIVGLMARRDTVPAADHEEIARLAYAYWEAGGHLHGSSLDNWLRAERELRDRAASELYW